MIFDAVLQVPHALCRLLYLCFFRCADCFIFAGDFDDKPSAASSTLSRQQAGRQSGAITQASTRARDESMGVVGNAVRGSIHGVMESASVAPCSLSC